MSEGIAAAVLEFIANHVDAVELLEVLAVLHTERKAMSIQDVNTVIRSTEHSIQKRVMQLESIGIIRIESDDPILYRYEPQSQELKETVDAVLEAYRLRRTEVIELIFSKPLREILSFSEAFRVRGGKKDG